MPRPSTFTEKVHDEFAARVAPDKLIEVAFPVAVIVPPPQEPLRPLGLCTAILAGRLSVKPMPVSPIVVLLFWMVKAKLVEPPEGYRDL